MFNLSTEVVLELLNLGNLLILMNTNCLRHKSKLSVPNLEMSHGKGGWWLTGAVSALNFKSRSSR